MRPACCPIRLPSLTHQLQSLKETFAAKLPGEIEKIKKLRKYVLSCPRPPQCTADIIS